jgi:hypothetical protein
MSIKKQIALVITATGTEWGAGDRWEFAPQSYGARDARGRAGWSSIRIDKATLGRLQALQTAIPKLLHKEGEHQYIRGLSLTELLELVSQASLCMHPAAEPSACIQARSPVHAARDPKVHASGTSNRKTNKVHASPRGETRAPIGAGKKRRAS